MRKRRHRWLDHTSEVQLQVEAESLAGLAAEAGRALGLLLLREGHDVPVRPEGPARKIQVESVDREALLVDWLNEILFLAEVERWVAVEFDILEISSVHLKASALGVPVEESPALVKAATFHGLAVEERAGGLQAEVIFDV
ncbi:MAG TPA: archease [Thermoanaerobaculia bacterium]|jgi:SHS2 domain-containing protein|nr:archease [Thermoanaerobaculia bacterium]